jgi:hypothetical protein
MAKDKESAVVDRETTTITASRSFANKVRTIGDRRGMTMAEVLDEYAIGIDREYRKALDEMNRELGESGA